MRHRFARARRPLFVLSAVMCLFASAVGMVTCGESAIVRAVIKLDPHTTHQTILGWEATAQVGQEEPGFPTDPPYDKYKDELFDLIVNDLGINRVRLEVRSGSENVRDDFAQFRAGQIDRATWRCRRYATVNDNDDPATLNLAGFHFSELDSNVESAVLPVRTRVEANGERLFVNLNYVAFTDQICDGSSYHHDNPKEYAEFIVAVFLHVRDKYGFVPDAVEIILEPDNTGFWRGRQIGEAIVETAARLAAHGFRPRFVAPSNTNMAGAVRYFDDMMTVPGVAALLSEFSYHRYSGVSGGALKAIGARVDRYKVQSAMLEKMGATYEDLHADLKVAHNSSWARYIIGDHNRDTDGLYYQVDVRDHPTVKRVGDTGFLRQYFKFVRSGAVRIEAFSDRAEVDPLAFVNSDSSFVVVVKSGRASVSRIEGLPSGTYGVSYSTDGTSIESHDVQVRDGQPIEVSIPGRGVLTVCGKRTRSERGAG